MRKRDIEIERERLKFLPVRISQDPFEVSGIMLVRMRERERLRENEKVRCGFLENRPL